MLKQDLYADEDKYNAACGFGFGLVFCSENSAGLNSAAGYRECSHADDKHCTDRVEKLASREKLHGNAREGDSNGEGVDTGSHASMNIVLTSILLVSFSSSFERASRSMLPPMSTSSPNAKKAGAHAPA